MAKNLSTDSVSESNQDISKPNQDFPPRHVAVLIETDDSWGRRVVRAIADYAHSARWTLLIAPRDGQQRLRLPYGWDGDGVLVSLRDLSMVEHVRAAQRPAVDLSMTLPNEDWLGRVATDDMARAKLAFEHFRQRELENFACYAPPLGRYADVRADAFERVVEAAGYTCSKFEPQSNSQPREWLIDHRAVKNWLDGLPRPLAVFASDAYPARQLAESCEWNGIRIPDEIALLAGDDDDLLCEVARPRLSSVCLASERIGYDGCAMLSALMNGVPIPKEPTLIPPLRIIARHSTDVMAIDDALLVDTLRFIRERATEGIQVSDVLQAFPVSRRSLERRYRVFLKRTPAEEIRRVRLEHARALLLETEMSISSVALASGFSSGAYLSHAFRRHLNTSPGEVRQGVQRKQRSSSSLSLR